MVLFFYQGIKKILVKGLARDQEKSQRDPAEDLKEEKEIRSRLSGDGPSLQNRENDFGFGDPESMAKMEDRPTPSPKEGQGHGRKRKLHLLKRLNNLKSFISGDKEPKIKQSKADNSKRKHFNMYESASEFKKNCDQMSADDHAESADQKGSKVDKKATAVNPTHPFRIMSHDSMFTEAGANKRVNCGLYKVSDQIIIDYDDNKQIQFQNYFLEDMFLFDHEDQTSNPSFTQLSENKKSENDQRTYQPSFDGTNQITSSDHILVESAENINDPFSSSRKPQQSNQESSRRGQLSSYGSRRFSSHDAGTAQDTISSTYNQIHAESFAKKPDLNIKDPFERFEKIYYDDLNG